MKNIVAVGFDMDYTLAQYVRETYESLAYQLTVEKLVENLQYPPEVGPVNLVVLFVSLFTVFFFFFFFLLMFVSMVIEVVRSSAYH